MPRKTKIILNPMADMGNAWRVARDLRAIVADTPHTDWSGTVYPGHAVDLARQAGEQGYDLVIAMGGDGTVHEVVNGLMQIPEENRPMLGVVPVGSGNDFAYAAGLPTSPEKAMLLALRGTPSTIDLMKMTDDNGRVEYVDNTLGIGFDAIVTIRSHRLPVLRGFLMYLTAVIQTILLNYDPATLTVKTDQEEWELAALMFTLCNGPREGGGFHVAPEAKLDDERLQYITIKKVSRLRMFRLVPEVMNGTHGRFPDIKMGEFTRLSLTSDRPLYIHADGEILAGFGSSLRSLDIELIPRALQVIRNA
jgi:YegS/Rv2252/BmrU family lipid kinase